MKTLLYFPIILSKSFIPRIVNSQLAQVTNKNRIDSFRNHCADSNEGCQTDVYGAIPRSQFRIEGLSGLGDIHQLKYVMKNTFFRDEPSVQLFKLTGDEYCGEILDVMMSEIDYKMSLVAKCNLTNEMVGFALNGEFNQDKLQKDLKSWSLKVKEPRNRKLLALWGVISKHFDYRCVTPSSRAMELFYLGVVPRARRQGLAKRLVQETLHVAKKKRFGLVQVFCTSNRSAKICKSLGLCRACTVEYDSLHLPLDGRPVVTRPPPPPDQNIQIYYHITC